MRNHPHQHQYSSKQHHYNSHQHNSHSSPTFERSKSGSRLDLSFATSNFPEDYLPYTASYSRNKDPYLVWDNGFNNDSTSDQHYQHTTASIDSHSPASLNHYHMQSHNHLYPTCSASSSSWPSAKKRKCCGFSCGCCAVSLLAVIIITALATVVGFSIYLAMITNLHKSSLVTLNGNFKVETGDNFNKNLLNTSSIEYMKKAAKYETILKTALESSAINSAINKQEVYAFRKGSLIVFFRVYLDRRKFDSIMESETKDDEKYDFDELFAVKLVQREIRDGISQLKITGTEQIIIDIKSIRLTNEFDPMIDHNFNDIKTGGISLNKASTQSNPKDPKLLSSKSEKSQTREKSNTSMKPTLPSSLPSMTKLKEMSNQTAINTLPTTSLISTTFATTTHSSIITTTHTSNEAEETAVTTNKSNYKFTNAETKPTSATTKSLNKNQLMPFTRRQSTAQPSITSPVSSTNLRITTRTKMRSTTASPVSISSQSSDQTFTTRVLTIRPQNSSQALPSNDGNVLLKRTEVKDERPKFSGINFGQWKPVTQQQVNPTPKPLPPKPLPPKPMPPPIRHSMPNHMVPQNLAPLLRPPPRVGIVPPQFVSNRPMMRIPLPIGVPMREVPRLLDDGDLDVNITDKKVLIMRDERLLNSTTSHTETTLTTLLPINSSTMRTAMTTSTTSSPTMVDGFVVPVSVAQDSQSEVSLHTPVINMSDSYFSQPMRDIMRKNKSLSALHEKQTTKYGITSVTDDSLHSSQANQELFSHEVTHSPVPVRHPIPELSVGSPVLHLSRLPTNGSQEVVKDMVAVNDSESLSVETQTLGSQSLAFNQTENGFESTVRLNITEKVPKTKSPFDYYAVINESLFLLNSTLEISQQTFTTVIDESTRTPATGQPIFPKTALSTPSPYIEMIAGLPIGIDKTDEIIPEKLIRPLSSSEPAYGERLPKYIPPALYQKFPSNDLVNTEIGQNGSPDEDVADQALFDDEIVSLNQSSLMLNDDFYPIKYENMTTTSQGLETTTAPNSCTETEFQCGSGECVSTKAFCNRRIECNDGSDERSCTCANYLRTERQFKKLCDGVIDCLDSSDEIDCPYCKGSFVCSGSNLCINRTKICNGDNDCPNGDDESECIALVNDNQKPETTGKYYSPEGALYIRQKGEWAPLCLDHLNMPNDLDNLNKRYSDESWKIEDLGKAICRANSFHDLESVGLISLSNYKSNAFFKMEEPSDTLSPTLSMWSSLFEKTECSSKKTTYVKCNGFECGVRPAMNGVRRRIVGGQSASLGSWPWQVALYREGEFQCGGVIINSQWLLTAAHCFHATRDAYWTARFGILRRGNLFESPYEQLRRITHVIVHSEYVDKGFINDIALLRLNEPINYSKHVRPVCLPEEQDDVSKWHRQLCTTVGWGKLFEHGRIFPDTLQEVKLPVISTEECRKRTLFLPLYKITDNMFCAGYDRGGRDACLGDSGGPMMCQKRNGKWFLLGVTSNGDGCGRAGRPGVYTKVAKYMEWIDEITNSVLEPEVNRKCDGMRCPLGRCLKKDNICNGIIDCRDASDEQNCINRSENITNYFNN